MIIELFYGYRDSINDCKNKNGDDYIESNFTKTNKNFFVYFLPRLMPKIKEILNDEEFMKEYFNTEYLENE